MFCATLAPRPSSKASWRSSPAPWPSSRPPASEPPRAWRRRTPDRTAVRVAPRSLRGGLQAPRNLVGTNARERIQEIFHRDDARAAWSRMADQAERIALAVPPFVMRQGDSDRSRRRLFAVRRGESDQAFGSGGAVPLHDATFFCIRPTRPRSAVGLRPIRDRRPQDAAERLDMGHNDASVAPWIGHSIWPRRRSVARSR